MTIPLVLGVVSIGGCSTITKGVRAETTVASSSPSSRAGASTTRTTLTTPTAVTTVTTTTSATTTAPGPPASVALHGMVVTIDPGHNGGNFSDPSYIGTLIWNGRENETCDTTGTATAGGYTEAQFNFNVAEDLEADLRAEGASVVLTRTSNTGVGPCVTQRAAIGNHAHADAAISIHADGGPDGGRGFAILEPVADGVNDAVVAPSQVLGADVRTAFLSQTAMPLSTYDGTDGVAPRDDLAGLNLTTVPKVLIECGNMRNTTDAAMLVSPAWQARAAHALASGITTFLLSRPASRSAPAPGATAGPRWTPRA